MELLLLQMTGLKIKPYVRAVYCICTRAKEVQTTIHRPKVKDQPLDQNCCTFQASLLQYM